jgi:hypothetical protein
MDGNQFDGLSRQLASAQSRRGALISVVGGTLALLGGSAASARKHHKGHGPKHRAWRAPARCQPVQATCDQDCCAGLVCGSNSCASQSICCGAETAACTTDCDCCSGFTCGANGQCHCDGRVCDNQCRPGAQCCTDADCLPNFSCVAGGVCV